MKVLTVTLRVTPGVAMPEPPAGSSPFGDFAGFRFTVTSPSGAKSGPPAENKLVWTFGGLIEGTTIKLLIEAVDQAGTPIQALEELVLNVPGVKTYSRLDGVDLAWS